MALTNHLIKLIPHDATPEQIMTMLAGVFVALILSAIMLVYRFVSERMATVLIAVVLVLGVRWVYRNGVGVLGWRGRWLWNSDVVIGSLCSEPQQKGTLRVVCISDTHAKHRNIKNIPHGDVLLHCGDFTNRGTHDEIRDFNDWIGGLPHRHKVVIAGNHDVCMDQDLYDLHWNKQIRHKTYNDPSISRSLLTNCTYLENNCAVVEGVKIYGSPGTPPIPGRVGAFNVPRGAEDEQYWSKVPNDVDILVTHGPPHGILDSTFTGLRVGSEALLSEINSRIQPRFNVFGHIHEAYGATRVGQTVFVNAATSTLLAKPRHAPVVLDIPTKC
ncbi:hypothetical protein PHYPSEUDO_009140 [Phytophthora pseudosyringae]|uniref:Calcineurin-like phosphoesterase domain-containing protein n=1 Tax=Phytophthora pseudosyringae TaxID=221518 RepID=A0A8T1VD89_9STRA|nr:hypothetical protein PHYPSEUDO_009140 [Phytophthora pseudosyringae]